MPELHITINDQPVRVAAGTTVAAALALLDITATRHDSRGEPRAPFCGIGLCQECRVSIDGVAHRLACRILCDDGMQVSTT